MRITLVDFKAPFARGVWDLPVLSALVPELVVVRARLVVRERLGTRDEDTVPVVVQNVVKFANKKTSLVVRSKTLST